MRDLIRYYLWDKSQEDDVYQDVQRIITEKGHTARNRKAWTATIIKNLCINRNRRLYKLRKRYTSTDINSIVDTRNPGLIPEVRRQIKAAVENLDPIYRSVIKLYYFEYKSLKEIATELDIPVGTVKSRMHKAKKKLSHGLSNV